MGELAPWFVYASFFGHVSGAVACAAAAVWIFQRGDTGRPDRSAAIIATGLTALWCAFVAAYGARAPVSELAETVRNVAWIVLLFRHFANDGRDKSLSPIRPVVLALAFVAALQPILLVIKLRFAFAPEVAALTFQISAIFKMLVAVGALVLLHNLYAGAANQSRRLLRWSAIAMTGFWAYELNYQTVGYLAGDYPVVLTMLRGFVTGLCVIPLAIGSNSAVAGLYFRPSRAVAFQSFSLLVIGAYLLLMMFVAQSLSTLGGGLGRFTQVGFLVLASVLVLAWLPSERLRGWWRVTAVKHLFQHRYDYREEWLRFTETVGRGVDAQQSFEERAVKAIADLTDSPGGLLLVPGDDGQLELAARWQWPSVEVPAVAMPGELAAVLEREAMVLDLDELRQGKRQSHDAAVTLPEWIEASRDAWAVAPLLHFDRLVGAVVLARPSAGRKLDWEDFDLLRVAGRQLASYLAERAGHQALMEASRFDEFNRRIAFVMHDIKNLASQLALLARNAEKHADNPAFRADMLVTLRNSADKLNTLLARLGRYGAGHVGTMRPVELLAVARRVAARFAVQHPVALTRDESCLVLADEEALEQAVIHLVQNGIDASAPDSPVHIDVSCGGLLGRLEVIDSGAGMSPEFVRQQLFKPFTSSKSGGFGIGAFEARELVRAMGGRLSVESREGLGTRFSLLLPVWAASGQGQDPAAPYDSEVA